MYTTRAASISWGASQPRLRPRALQSPLCPAARPDTDAGSIHHSAAAWTTPQQKAGATPTDPTATPRASHKFASAAAAKPVFSAYASKGVVRQAVQKPWSMHPDAFGALVLLASFVALSFARVRLLIADIICKARSCTTCRGFGVRRCDMCGGIGQVRWDAKWVHTDPCPKCSGKRYCQCEECGGGVFRRHLFPHIERNAAMDARTAAKQAAGDPLAKFVD